MSLTDVESRDLSFRDKIRQGCASCSWSRRRTQVVPSEGPLDSPLMIVGRNPGAQEDRCGRPFIGPAGTALDLF
jgi:uracil-DNA glycosylase